MSTATPTTSTSHMLHARPVRDAVYTAAFRRRAGQHRTTRTVPRDPHHCAECWSPPGDLHLELLHVSGIPSSGRARTPVLLPVRHSPVDARLRAMRSTTRGVGGTGLASLTEQRDDVAAVPPHRTAVLERANLRCRMPAPSARCCGDGFFTCGGSEVSIRANTKVDRGCLVDAVPILGGDLAHRECQYQTIEPYNCPQIVPLKVHVEDGPNIADSQSREISLPFRSRGCNSFLLRRRTKK
ncbi:hypothetical protein C8R47DRAFT_1082974 [Mycena vitilis]|nr:hypothetical protein C8R47DRAFT_1082974 [Mycena vitilis]